jgi:hypothetical protein
MTGLFKITQSDFLKGAVTAVFAAIVWSIGSAASQAGFDVFSADWGPIVASAINAGVSAFVGYMGKNFLTDANGKVLGKI